MHHSPNTSYLNTTVSQELPKNPPNPSEAYPQKLSESSIHPYNSDRNPKTDSPGESAQVSTGDRACHVDRRDGPPRGRVIVSRDRECCWARTTSQGAHRRTPGTGTEGQAPQTRPSRRDFIHDPEPPTPSRCVPGSFSKGWEGRRYITAGKRVGPG